VVNLIENIKNKFPIKFKDNFLLWTGLVLIFLLVALTLALLKLKTKQELVLGGYENKTVTPIVKVNNSVAYYKPLEGDKFELSKLINSEITDILEKVYSIIDKNNSNLSIKGVFEVSDQSVIYYPNNGKEMWDSASPSVRWLVRAMDVKKNLNATFSDTEIEEIKKSKLRFLSLIKEELIKNGFIDEEVDSFDYPTDFFEYYEEYYVFSKGEIKCVVVSEILSEDNAAITVRCSDQYKKNYQYKTRLIEDLGSDLSEVAVNRPLSKVVLFDRYGIFTFISRGQSFLVTGMMDANDEWHILWQGLTGDGLPCELLDKYPMFKENYPTTYCFYREGERTGEYVEWN
jgi:hypothetical protein